VHGTTRRGRPVRRGQPDPWLTVEEAGEALGVSAMTVRRRVKAGQFPAVVIASVTRVPRAFVDRVIQAAEAGETVIVEQYAAEWADETAGRAS
jgi:excisionase family DNA binding protein